MNYTRHYNKLVERAKNRSLTTYTERHHVVPQCLGGNNSKDNLVDLTPEEHYVAHQLLVKIYSNSDNETYRKVLNAWNKMSQGRTKNKRYGWLKRRWQKECKKRTGKNNPNYGRSWYHDPATLENGTFIPGTEPIGWVIGKKPKQNKKCIVCREDTENQKRKYCNNCRKKVHINNINQAIQKNKNTRIDDDKKIASRLETILPKHNYWKYVLEDLGFKNTRDRNNRERVKRIAREYNLHLGL